jgi:hypothetical protein
MDWYKPGRAVMAILYINIEVPRPNCTIELLTESPSTCETIVARVEQRVKYISKCSQPPCSLLGWAQN